jgi:hypothetical protein
MSFPSEPVILQLEDILSTDIIIEDRKLVALGGNELATQASNTAAKSSFYSKLIVSLADSIRSRKKAGEAEWTLDTYKLATEKIINLVTKTKSSVLRRFVWFRQFPEAHYVVMTRTQTINKLANDLDCQMRKIEARELSEAQETNKQQQKPNQHRYAQSLIYKVCRAARKGMSPYQAVLLLDHPIVRVQEPSQNTSDEMNTDKRIEASEESNHESESGRKLRLQLRHRFLACIRSKKCIFDLANALLTMWGLPNISKIAPKPKKRKRPDMSTKTSPPCKKKKVESVPHNLGHWNLDERVAFLEGFEQFGAPHWVKIAPFVSTRYVLDFIDILCGSQ